jgi:hypothetical protein
MEREEARGRELHPTVLSPLFFGCLNTPLHERTLAARKLGRIPYLNGGLFEPSPFELRHGDARLPNELIRRVLEQVFERFDFRAGEDDPSGTQVDPEMLGKVFESLMAAEERASSGSYYTPREVVDLLTGRAIGEWLGDQRDARAALDRLTRITVVDPACGSGAFLLSSLGVIERLWRELSARCGADVPPDLRRRIVARSLYGVDKKPEAVRLCELRLWLAIVSATDLAIEDVEPLPNLDRNILQGNSLLSPTDFLGDARGDIYRDWLVALRAQRDLIDRYRTAPQSHRPAICRVIRGNDQRLAMELLSRVIESNESDLQHAVAPRRDLFGRAVPLDADLCARLHQRIDHARELIDRLEEGALDFFSFDIHFAPVMAGGGFDVVVGNPPWVRNSRIDAGTKRMLADRYSLFRASGSSGAFHQPDLSLAFFERAVSLSAPRGVIALLMPSKIANAGYAAPLRRFAQTRTRIISIDDWSDDARARKWFAADTFPLGIVLQNCSAAADGAIRVAAAGESFSLAHEQLTLSGSSCEWVLVPPDVSAIAARLRARLPSLEHVLGRRPFMGVKTGDNGTFFLDVRSVDSTKAITVEGFEIPLDAICRCVRGRDVRRWHAASSEWMLWPPARGWPEPPGWLIPFAAARGARPQDVKLSFVRPEHVGVKVVWKDLSRGLAAAVVGDEEEVGGTRLPLIPNQTLYAIDCASYDEAHAIAAILNSKVATALLLTVTERAKDAHQRYFGRTVATLPWCMTARDQDRLSRLSRMAHRGENIDEELDRIVARLYGLSSRELEILRSFMERRLGAGSR